jgi:DNA-binding Lrp family transcriptional regulator
MAAKLRANPATLDEKDQLIAECILLYPQASIEAIADETRIAVSTVQKRLAEMLAREQLARIIEIRDWKAAQFPVRYRIDVQIDQDALMEGGGGGPKAISESDISDADGDPDEVPMNLPRPAHEIRSQQALGRYIKNRLARSARFRRRLVCLDVVMLMGAAYDLSVTVRARDTDAVTEFVTRGLKSLRAVGRTTSTLEPWSCADEELRALQSPGDSQHVD